MTVGNTDNHDQASLNRPTAGDSTSSSAKSGRKRSSEKQTPAERSETERRRPGDALAIGAPLSAAFVGGFLVIENLAGADQPDASDAANPSDGEASLDGEDADAPDLLTAQGQSSGTAQASQDGQERVDDPAAAPSEDGAIPIGTEGGGSASAIPAVASAGEGVALPEETGNGGSGASLNFFNIDIGGEGTEADAGSGAIVEDAIISRNRQVGTPGDDILTGTDGHDAISGGEGNDIIRGLGGSDVLNGNGGDDQLFGGAGRDRLDGGAGNDRLDGGNDGDLDLLKGGSGDDVLVVNGRNDVALESYASGGIGGDDLLIVRSSLANDLPSGADGFTFAFGENHGIDLPEGSAAARRLVGNNIENLRLEGSANHDIFADSQHNSLDGNDGNNRIIAGGGDDRVTGGGGADRLDGGDGDDELSGGAGADRISGGLGRDMLYGNGGDDVFVIGLNDSAIDTIFDHEGANRLTLEGVTDQTVEAALLGDDLYVTVDDTPVALVSGYVGHENALAGIDYGQGLKSIDTLLTDQEGLATAIDEAEAKAAEAASDDLLAAHLHLNEPTVLGDPRADQRLDGTEGDDWLSGFDGRDVLFGHDGDDILEGGGGTDQLRGGAGDDRYLFSKGDQGIDKIQDAEGRNLAELRGYDHAEIEGAMLGDDLAVLADGKVLFTVDDFASNEGSFHGVQAGNKFIQTEDLLA